MNCSIATAAGLARFVVVLVMLTGTGVTADGPPPPDRRLRLQQFTETLAARLAAGDPVGIGPLRQQLRDWQPCSIRARRPGWWKKGPSRLYEQCCPGVVMVGTIYKCGKCHHWHGNIASGFVISRDGAVVTNYHVLAESLPARAIAVQTWEGRLLPVERVLASSRTDDLVVLKVAAGGLTPLPIARRLKVGQKVFCISHPVNHFYTMTDGVVSGLFSHDGRAELAITADFAKGSSGAPVLNEKGAVVGIVRATSPVYYSRKDGIATALQMVWKYCVPSTRLLALLDPSSQPPEAAPPPVAAEEHP